MRAQTKGKHGMGRRFAIVIGVAAVGVMALGAQTGAQAPAQLHQARRRLSAASPRPSSARTGTTRSPALTLPT